MSNDDLKRRRHSAAHLMAWAVTQLFDNVKLDIGPATDDGFYYDFDMEHRLGPDDLPRIEEEMKRLAQERDAFECWTATRAEAESSLQEQGQDYKVERLADIPEDEEISFYRCGDFSDLCRGPHVEHTGAIGAFKLLSIAGSYFRGKETNPMLQRVYGTAFASPKELRLHLSQIDEAKKRDHRKLGQELDLFSVNDEIGAGLILWHPKGARIRNTIESFWRDEHFANGYELLYSPHIGLADLWETSGHLECYSDAMYSPLQIDERDFYVRPMNCPFHIKVYQSRQRSYRELPLRWAELGTVYRYEKSGVLHGLLRVRGFTQDDAHIFCTPAQIEDEVCEVLRFSLELLRGFGFDNVKIYLATRPEKAVGEPERWEQATRSLEQAVQRAELDYEVDEGGGAFYGPKIDIKIKDALGREWQCTTIQFDFNLPERFDMFFIGEDGQRQRPYMVHRALLGALERFFALLVEHHAGAFPVWLAPEQARILPIADRHHDYAMQVRESCVKAGVLATVDVSSEGLGKKIRNGRNDRLPYLLVVGDREQEGDAVSVRHRGEGELGSMSVAAFIERICGEIAQKV